MTVKHGTSMYNIPHLSHKQLKQKLFNRRIAVYTEMISIHYTQNLKILKSQHILQYWLLTSYKFYHSRIRITSVVKDKTFRDFS